MNLVIFCIHVQQVNVNIQKLLQKTVGKQSILHLR